KVTKSLTVFTPLRGAVGVFGKGRSLVGRIHMIAHYRKPSIIETVLGVLLFLVLGAFGLTDVVAEVPRKTDVDPAPAAAKAEDTATPAIAGFCQDEAGKPLSGVRVFLFREDQETLQSQQVETNVAGDDGQFRFRAVPNPLTREGAAGYTLIATKQGRGST